MPKATPPPSARVFLSGEALAAHAADTGLLFLLTKIMRQIGACNLNTMTQRARSGLWGAVWSYV
jgi:hypothetical protein